MHKYIQIPCQDSIISETSRINYMTTAPNLSMMNNSHKPCILLRFFNYLHIEVIDCNYVDKYGRL